MKKRLQYLGLAVKAGLFDWDDLTSDVNPVSEKLVADLMQFAEMVEAAAMTPIGYVHPYGIEQLHIHTERGEKWSTPISSMPFDGAIKVYARVE